MRLTQGEIRSNAIRFAAEWKDAANEQAEAQSFWTELFAVYGIKRRSVASFEEKVRNLKGASSRIDVFCAGVMLGEHKSRGEDLTKAQSQAFDYVQSLTREGRHSEVPQFIVLSDFETIVVFDLEAAAADPRVRAVATVSAFSSWQAVASDMLPVVGPFLIRPGTDPESAAARLADRPLFIMHGERDEIIPLRHAGNIHAAAEQAGVPAHTSGPTPRATTTPSSKPSPKPATAWKSSSARP